VLRFCVYYRMRILIATRNPWKAGLFATIFRRHGFDVYTPDDVLPAMSKPVECGRSVVENALIKARHYYSLQHPLVFADDTGLEIDVLAGAPGVQFRRWGGALPDDVSDEAWLQYLLAQMADVPAWLRTACLVDGWALITPDGDAHTYTARAAFEIAECPVRPVPAGSPIMAVGLGLPETPEQAHAALAERWSVSGMPAVLRKFSHPCVLSSG
jgi:inosine/xanthosine triphosphate pyrophosphatase family protein